MLFHGHPNICRRFWYNRISKIPGEIVGGWKIGLYCYNQEENLTEYFPALVQVFRGISFQDTRNILFQVGLCLPSRVLRLSPQFANLLVTFQNARPPDTRVYYRSYLLKHFNSDFITTCNFLGLQRIDNLKDFGRSDDIFLPKILCVGCYGLNGSKISLNYSLNLRGTSISLLSNKPFWSLINLQHYIYCRCYIWWFSRTRRWLVSKRNLLNVRNSPNIALWTFNRFKLWTLALQHRMVRRFGFVEKPDLEGCLLCSNSIFTKWLHQVVTFWPSVI